MQAGNQGKHRKVAKDKEEAVAAPVHQGQRWVKTKGGERQVDVVIVGDGSDPEPNALRAHVARLGGTVHARFSLANAISASLPAKALKTIDLRSEDESISPNRTTGRTLSELELVTGVTSASVRTGNNSGAHSGLDGTGVGIAVLDSGVMATHLHMANASGVSRVTRQIHLVGKASNALAASARAPGSAARLAFEASIVPTGAAVPDAYGHGTHVAAVAAGPGFVSATNDSAGVAPGASIIDVKVIGADGSGNMADVLAGIDWVIHNAKQYNIRVMNLSLAASSTESWRSDPMARAVRSAAATGITVVVAAGNYGKIAGAITFGTVASPAHDPSVITVGSSHMQNNTLRSGDTINGFSSRGPTRGAMVEVHVTRNLDNLIKPDLVAPGNLIVSAAATSVASPAGVWNNLPASYPELLEGLSAGQTYGRTRMRLSGTSVAAPVVSGAIALLPQANPELTGPMLKAILQYTAQPLPNASLVEQGAGMLNIDGAVRLAQSFKTDAASKLAASAWPIGAKISAGILPTPSSTINGQTFNWSRIVTVGGRQIANGDQLFSNFQPVYDPRLTRGGSTVVRRMVT